jgi:hypothetical protein
MKSLHVLMGGIPMGTLIQAPSGRLTLEYLDSWTRSPLAFRFHFHFPSLRGSMLARRWRTSYGICCRTTKKHSRPGGASTKSHTATLLRFWVRSEKTALAQSSS